ncbi:hypothetical protein [Salinicoccus roseus]|uniref:Uncharacterized protein n=1 Tax=Salinicoccus roseus TaxID=45670 RepID=A0A0C2DJ01_9STAP|nr:hypothetical protein [Salinicoccus roseus]KIH69933.1 hypothetical protein SN16_10480 [Salinicoccus roseus]MDB0581225.1 hypothetical protein [Salinicoccus roseus]
MLKIDYKFDDKKLRKELGKKADEIIKKINKELKKQPSDKFVRKHFKFRNAKELFQDVEEKGCKSLDEYLKKYSKFSGEKEMVDKIVSEEIKV